MGMKQLIICLTIGLCGSLSVWADGSGIESGQDSVDVENAVHALYTRMVANNGLSEFVTFSRFQDAALAGDIEKIAVIPSLGEAVGILTRQGAENQHLNSDPMFDGEKRLITVIPSLDRMREKIDFWNGVLKETGRPCIKYVLWK